MPVLPHPHTLFHPTFLRTPYPFRLPPTYRKAQLDVSPLWLHRSMPSAFNCSPSIVVLLISSHPSQLSLSRSAHSLYLLLHSVCEYTLCIVPFFLSVLDTMIIMTTCLSFIFRSLHTVIFNQIPITSSSSDSCFLSTRHLPKMKMK